MNLVGVLAGYFEQLFVVVGLQVVTLQRTLHARISTFTPFPTFPTEVFPPIVSKDAWMALLRRIYLPRTRVNRGLMTFSSAVFERDLVEQDDEAR